MKQRLKFDADERPEATLIAYKRDPFDCFAGQRVVDGERHYNGDMHFRLMKNETLTEPPIVADGEVAVFLERLNEWTVVSDHRGETWFDWADRPQLIVRPGNPEEWGLRKEPRHVVGASDGRCEGCT